MDSAEWDARYAESRLLWTADPNRFLVEEVAGYPPGRALDLAAGEGRNAVWLAERGWSVTAVDFSAVAVASGRELARSRGVDLDWVVADVLDWRPEPAAFDLVLVAYLHLPPAELSGVLATAARAVAPGGTVLVIGHDVANLTEGVGGPRDPAILYRAERITAGLPGLNVLRAGSAVRPVATESGERLAIDTVVVAHREHD